MRSPNHLLLYHGGFSHAKAFSSPSRTGGLFPRLKAPMKNCSTISGRAVENKKYSIKSLQSERIFKLRKRLISRVLTISGIIPTRSWICNLN